MGSVTDRVERWALRIEIARLIVLRESHGIEWHVPSRPCPPPAELSTLTYVERVYQSQL
jgi:hypothetical protein